MNPIKKDLEPGDSIPPSMLSMWKSYLKFSRILYTFNMDLVTFKAYLMNRLVRDLKLMRGAKTSSCFYCDAAIELYQRPDNFGGNERWDNHVKGEFCPKCCSYRHGRLEKNCGNCRFSMECDSLNGSLEAILRDPEYYPGANFLTDPEEEK